ncbi:MAG: hypothetical protein QOE98_10 [Gaiellaceae bacterium]|nr:hypothetical protein [Gaiellaceae bacterium]
MRFGVPARLGLFALGLLAVFGAAAALGVGVHPGQPGHSGGGEMSGMKGMGGAMGVVVNDGSYAITPATFQVTPGRPATLSFTIVDQKGRVVRDGFEIEAERRLHLIVARRDLTGYQHLHPTQAGDGTWSTPLTVTQAGAYRVFADFQRDGVKHVLAADLTVPGTYVPEPLPAPTAATATDGFEITLEHQQLRAGQEGDLDFTVSRDGRPVEAIEPYLGARGHLVALREGDVAYLHVHPHDGHQQAGVVPFAADFVSAGNYRLFLQFQVAGVVHTAAFTVEVTP